jgi:hypothetical protein
MIGNQRPRLVAYPPDVDRSLGVEGTELAKSAGLILDDWESWSLENILGIRSNGKWSAFECLEIVGRQNGKGAILEARELAGLFLVPTDVYIAHTAHEFKTARKHFYRLKYLIENTPELARRVDKISEAHGQEAIILLPTPTVIMGSDSSLVTRSVTKSLEILARSQGSGRGFTGDLLVYDEAMILDALKVGATLPTLSARPNPQVIYMASAGFKTSTQLSKVRRRGVDGKARALFFAEWSIDPCDEYCPSDCKRHDIPGTIESYAKSNPAMGIRINLEYLENEREAFEGGEAEWMRERLGVGEYPMPLDAWAVIPRRWFDATCDSAEDLPRPDYPIFGVDMPPDRSMATIFVAGLRPDGLVGLEMVERRLGTSWLVPRIKELDDKWNPEAWAVDPRSGAGTIIDELEFVRIPVAKMNAQDVAHSNGQMFDAFRDDLIRHRGEAALRSAIAGADKRPLSEAWAFDRKNAAVDISPLMAASFALWGYMKFSAGNAYSISDSLHFDTDEIARLIQAGAYGEADLVRLKDEGILTDADIAAVHEKLAG